MQMAEFDRVGEQFVSYYDKVRGYVREQLIRDNLQEYLSATPATVIDIGGGDGRDAAWFAEQGYNVTLVEPSADMLAKAHQRFQANKLKVATYQVDPADIQDQFQGQKFDIVLSHGVLMYCLEDPEAHIETLAGLLKANGVLSLATKGFAGALYRAMYKRQMPVARALIRTEQDFNNLGLRVWAYPPERVQEMLGKHALRVLDWRGVRIASEHDKRFTKNVGKAELNQILRVEARLGADASTRGMGQMLHFIAQKS